MLGELNFRMTEKKHELTTWDCKLNRFHTHTTRWMSQQKMASSYKMMYYDTCSWRRDQGGGEESINTIRRRPLDIGQPSQDALGVHTAQEHVLN
eukprot:3347057-Rhodomonas_salina.1